MGNKGEVKARVVRALGRLISTFDVLNRNTLAMEAGISPRRATDYLLVAKKQGILTLDGKAYALVDGRNVNELNMSRGSRKKSIPEQAPPIETLKILLEKLGESNEYIKHLEMKVDKLERDNRDQMGYISRCLRAAPDPRAFRHPVPAEG